MSLTPLQLNILDFIKNNIRTHGYSPAVREIEAKFNLPGNSSVSYHLKKLKSNGMIRIEPSAARGIIVDELSDLNKLPAYVCRICGGTDYKLNGRMKYCPECHLARSRKYYAENPEKCRYISTPENREKGCGYRMKERYGIGPAQYNEMGALQGWRCAICGNIKKLSIDHNHLSGMVRGLLCRSCNLGLGNFMDSQGRLGGAIQYLKTGGSVAAKKVLGGRKK